MESVVCENFTFPWYMNRPLKYFMVFFVSFWKIQIADRLPLALSYSIRFGKLTYRYVIVGVVHP